MEMRILGTGGPVVSAIGLGAVGMSDFYEPADRGESIETVHAVLDAGITLVDAGDFDELGHNEMLLGEALPGRKREDAVFRVKFGAQRGADSACLVCDTRPAGSYRPTRWAAHAPSDEAAGAVAESIGAGPR